MESQEAEALAQQDNELSQLEVFAQNYALGQAAIEELALLKPILALAISRAPRQMLKISLSDHTRLGEWDVQMKQESKSGALVFRAVKSVGN